jgi:hypothetical protein
MSHCGSAELEAVSTRHTKYMLTLSYDPVFSMRFDRTNIEVIVDLHRAV